MKKLLATAAVLAMTSNAAFAGPLISNTTVGTTPVSVPFLGTINLPTGAIYSEIGGVANNVDTAVDNVTQSWKITGNVSKDCSYFDGGSNTHTLALGQIGVETQSNTTASNAFDMRSPAVVNVNTTTAGCNFKNSVTMTKTNGVDGLKNAAAAGYDSDEFQANIPYSVAATFRATTNTSAPAAGSNQTLTAGTGAASATQNYGAWRSSMNLLITAPVPGKALVAGNYEDTLTVVLQAL